MKRIILTLLISGIFATQALASTPGPISWEVAPGPSSVKFKVNHLIFSTVEGKFKDFEGTVISLADDLSDATMEARIVANSIYTGNEDRDKHLNGKDFFNTQKFPEITFKSKSFVKQNDCSYVITGDLTMRGVTKTIQLKAKCVKEKTLANGTKRKDLVATGSVNRFDYGIRWNELMDTGSAVVGKDIEISLKIALLKK